MSDFIQRSEQVLFLDSTRIRGIQSLDFQYNVNYDLLKNLGSDSSSFGTSGPQEGQLNVSLVCLSSDQLINLTGENCVNGYLLRNRNNPNENYSFTSGYLTSYRSRCSVGEIPELNASFSTFGNIGRLSQDEIPHFSGIQTGTNSVIQKTSFSDFFLDVDGFRIDHVISYDLDIRVSRRADYSLGSRSSRRVVTNWPIEISATFVISASDYEAYSLRKYPSQKRVSDLSLAFKNSYSQEYINSYSFPNMLLTEESYNSSVDSKSTVTLRYSSFKNKEELVKDGLVFYINTLNANMYNSANLIKDSTFNKIDFYIGGNGNSPSQSCLGFDGSTTYGESSKNYRAPASITFMTWIHPKGDSGDDQYLFCFGNGSKHGICNYKEVPSPKFSIRLNNTLHDIADPPAENVWSCICVVFNGGSGMVHYYLNGSLVDSMVLHSPIEESTGDLMFLGCLSPSLGLYGDTYYGSMAKTLLYNRALTSSEVALNYRVTSDCERINDTF